MKQTKKFSGMTLIEVTVGMAVIIIVTVIAYMGVSASANLSQHGTDLRNSDGPAVSMIESLKKDAEDANKNGDIPSVTDVPVKYDVKQVKYYVEPDSSAVSTDVSEIKTDEDGKAGLIQAKDGDVEYVMYLPVTKTP